MKFGSAKSAGFGVLMFGVPLLLAASAVIAPADVRLYVIAGAVLVSTFLMWIWFGTWYEFRDGLLLLRSGPFFERIPYERITQANRIKSMASSMALSSDMIELRHGENYITGTTMVSPADRDGFLQELRNRCPNLKQ